MGYTMLAQNKTAVFFVFTAVFIFSTLIYLSETRGQATTTTSTLSISVEIPSPAPPPAPPSLGGGGGTVLPTPAPAAIVFNGYSYPEALLYFLKDDSVVASEKADANGLFSKTFSTKSGISKFGIWAKDAKGLRSSTLNLSLNLIANSTTTVSNIFLSPTLASKAETFHRGAPLSFLGSSFPGSLVYLFINGVEFGSTITNASGFWTYSTTTGQLQPGTYKGNARGIITKIGLVSPLSDDVIFEISDACPGGADLNRDGRVDVADLSVMLFYWKKYNPKNICVDLNLDSFVDIGDFSLLMYYWTD